MDIWHVLSDETQAAALAAVLGALLSGMISLVAVVFAFRLTRRHDQNLREQSMKARRDANARVGLGKLISMINRLYSIDKHFSDQFRNASEDGASIVEPALAFVPTVIDPSPVDVLTPAEMEFLYFFESGSLVTEIQLFQSRVSTDVASLVEISRRREAFDEFALKNGSLAGEPDGAAVTTEFDERIGRQAEVMIGTLNRMIAGAVEKVERDLAEGLTLGERYREVAEQVFGEKFPKIDDAKGKN